jgi:hypothetical protein
LSSDKFFEALFLQIGTINLNTLLLQNITISHWWIYLLLLGSFAVLRLHGTGIKIWHSFMCFFHVGLREK